MLVGMMGSGKTTVGKALAELLAVRFADCDTLLTHRLGRSMPDIFRLYGQDAMRDHESATLRQLQPEPGVLATGGGVVLREDNWTEMRRLGTTVYLHAPEELLFHRLERGRHKRPLLAGDDWKDKVSQLLETRRALYEKADLTFTVRDAPSTTMALELKEALER